MDRSLRRLRRRAAEYPASRLSRSPRSSRNNPDRDVPRFTARIFARRSISVGRDRVILRDSFTRTSVARTYVRGLGRLGETANREAASLHGPSPHIPGHPRLAEPWLDAADPQPPYWRSPVRPQSSLDRRPLLPGLTRQPSRYSRSARSTLRTATSTTSATPGGGAATTGTRASTSSPGPGRRSGRRSTGRPPARRAGAGAFRCMSTAGEASCSTATCRAAGTSVRSGPGRSSDTSVTAGTLGEPRPTTTSSGTRTAARR